MAAWGVGMTPVVKTVKKPAIVTFETKSGETVSFRAIKTVKVDTRLPTPTHGYGTPRR